MNIRQLDFRSIFSARSVPSIFWIIVAISSCLALLLILFLVVQGYRDGIQRSSAQKRQQVAILLQRASDLLDEGRRQEALAEYGIILKLDANNEAARDAISTVEAMPPAQAIETEPAAPDPLEIEWAYALSQYEAGNLQEAIARMTPTARCTAGLSAGGVGRNALRRLRRAGQTDGCSQQFGRGRAAVRQSPGVETKRRPDPG